MTVEEEGSRDPSNPEITHRQIGARFSFGDAETGIEADAKAKAKAKAKVVTAVVSVAIVVVLEKEVEERGRGWGWGWGGYDDMAIEFLPSSMPRELFQRKEKETNVTVNKKYVSRT
ncbi:hypothetical protein M0804_007989 [Polistes exclamans]|nr:hypothetical protein M0804_007989 [Polistes exclamans]